MLHKSALLTTIWLLPCNGSRKTHSTMIIPNWQETVLRYGNFLLWLPKIRPFVDNAIDFLEIESYSTFVLIHRCTTFLCNLVLSSPKIPMRIIRGWFWSVYFLRSGCFRSKLCLFFTAIVTQHIYLQITAFRWSDMRKRMSWLRTCSKASLQRVTQIPSSTTMSKRISIRSFHWTRHAPFLMNRYNWM